MNVQFNALSETNKIPWPESISQHDLVFLSPPLDPIQGMPLGNGDLGALVWCEPRALVIAVNKCDLWDDAPETFDGHLNDPNLPHHTEEITSLRHGCRVTFDLGLPLMDSWYLQDFEARLDLARATATIRSVTPFGTFSARIFVSAETKCLVVDYRIEAPEPIVPKVQIERWGSRIGQMWYGQLDKNPRHGLDGTETEVKGDRLVITQQLRRMHFAVAAEVSDNQRATQARRLHRRGGELTMAATPTHAGTLFLTVVNSEESAAPVDEAMRLLAAARSRGVDALAAAHQTAWKDFWQDTFIAIDDKFLENLWFLTLYYDGSSQRGRYPGIFTQSLWGWNRDFQPWTYYFHWNQQQLAWPLCAANHPELMKSYLDFRFSQLEGAKAAARKKEKNGACYCDISDRLGHQAIEHNRTPGGQIAADFWRYFQYTGNLDYLRAKAWPVIHAVAQWHLGMLEKRVDGLYHTTPAWGYEGGNMLRDCTSELAATRRVFEIALESAQILGIDLPERKDFQEILEHLAPLVTMESPVNRGVTIIAAGIQKGIEKDAGKVLCGGFKEGDAEEWANPKPTCAHDPKSWGQIFSDVETSPIFPDGRIGLKDQGTKEFDLALATARESNMHWTKRIVYARMGMRDELWRELRELGVAIGHNGTWMSTGISIDIRDFWATARAADPMLAPKNYLTQPYSDDGKGPWADFSKSRIPRRMWEFRRIGFEASHLVTTAITEALLQSHDGLIRVAPTVEKGRKFAFILLAQGGFVVSAKGVGETVAWIRIASRRGGLCRLVNPWKDQTIFLRTANAGQWQELSGEVVSFPTEPGNIYLLSNRKDEMESCALIEEKLEINKGPRYSAKGDIVLGIPRMF